MDPRVISDGSVIVREGRSRMDVKVERIEATVVENLRPNKYRVQ